MPQSFFKWEQTIGHTPMVRFAALEQAEKTKAHLYGKLEYFNPAGSVKDRVAKAMLDTAEQEGRIGEGSVIIEPTSGNTGIGLAAVGKARGYRVMLTMPDTMSMERRRLLQAYGAELVLTDGCLGMQGAIAKAEELACQMPNGFIPGQFENPANPAIHQATTGPEIWRDSRESIDILVAGVGTGGTLTGAGTFLKQQNPAIKIIAVEPASSAVLSGGKPGSHKIQGIGAGFVPKILDTTIIDAVVAVENEAAYVMTKKLAQVEGVLAGISSGAALWAAMQLARQPRNSGKMIVLVMPDSGERYLTTGVFD